jgi:hypothetical protein
MACIFLLDTLYHWTHLSSTATERHTDAIQKCLTRVERDFLWEILGEA